MKLIKRLFSSGIIVLIIHTNVAGQPAVLKEAPIKVEEAGRIQPSAQPYYSPSFAPNAANWIAVDTMFNAYGTAMSEINPIAYDPWANVLAYVHRGNTNYSTGSGTIWYNISTDQGLTWRRVGQVNANTSQKYGRYPSMVISNPLKSSALADLTAGFSWPELTPSDFGFMGYGKDQPLGANMPFSALNIGNPAFATRVICWSGSNSDWIFWGADNLVDRSIRIYRTQNYTTLDSFVIASSVFNDVGEIICGGASGNGVSYTLILGTYPDPNPANPIASGWYPGIFKTTDNGITWTGPEVIDFRTIPGLTSYDRLFDFKKNDAYVSYCADINVDRDGNPHLLLVVTDTGATKDVGINAIIEIYKMGNSWAGNIVYSGIPDDAFGVDGIGLGQMGPSPYLAVNKDGNVFCAQWVSTPSASDPLRDIYQSYRYINGTWSPPTNITNTTDMDENSSHLAPVLKGSGTSYTAFSGYTYPVGYFGPSPNPDQPALFSIAAVSFNVDINQNLPTAPVLYFPGNNTSGVPVDSRLIWSRVNDATNYHIQVATDQNFSTIIINDSTLIDTSKQLNIFQPGIKYYWKVRAKNNFGYSSFSGVFNFSTISAPPSPPSLVAPLNYSVNISTSPTVSWSPVSGAIRYSFQLSTDPGFTNVLLSEDTLTSTSRQIASLSGSTLYYWRVRAYNNQGWGNYSTIWNFSTAQPAPGVPQLVSPLSNTQYLPTTVNVSWSPVYGADKYRLQVAKDSMFAIITFQDTNVYSSSATLSSLLSNTKYYWRVKSQNSSGQSAWSAVWNFKTKAGLNGLIVNLPLIVKDNSGLSKTLNFGLVQSATDSLDPDFENEIPPVPPAGILDARFNIANNISVWNDYRSGNENIVAARIHEIQFQPGAGNSITIAWNLPENISGRLQDIVTGSIIDVQMDGVDSLVVANPGAINRLKMTVEYKLGIPLAPALYQPINNTVHQLVSPVLKWSSRLKATHYKLEVATDSLFNLIVFSDSLIADTTKQLPALSYLKKYFWRVYARNSLGISRRSAIWNFTTIIQKPEKPILSSPSNNTIGLDRPVTLFWNSSLRAERYILEVSTVSNFGTLVIRDTSLTDTFKSLLNLNALTQYYWRVYSRNIGGISDTSTVWNFKTIGPPTIVTLYSPLNFAVNQAISGTLFNWSKATDQKVISNYWFEVKTDPGNTLSLLIDSTLTDTFKVLNQPVLNYLTSYYWRVKAKNQVGWGEFSSRSKFTTIIERPSKPASLFPANNSLGIVQPATIRWSKSLRVERYTLQVSTDAAFTNLAYQDTSISDTVKVLPLLANYTKYYWRVFAKNIGGTSDTSDVWNFKTLGAPYSVNLLLPLNNSINQPVNNLLFRWNKASERIEAILKYQIQISPDSLFTNYIINDTSLTDTFTTVNGLGFLTNYFWRVRATNETGWGDWSQTRKFRTVPQSPVVPVLLSPNNNSIGLVQPVQLKWYGSLRADKYLIQLSLDPNFSTVAYSDSHFVDTTKNLPVLNYYTIYYWRVKARNEGGESDWSSVWNFKTHGPPTVPTLVYPAHLAINLPVSLDFRWRRVSNLESTFIYNFELCTDTTGIPLIKDTTLTDTMKAVAGLQNNKDYFWRIRAKNLAGWGEYSQWSAFRTIVPLPATPVLIAPVNNASATSLTPVLIWNTSAYASWYHLQVASDSGFSVMVYNDSALTDTSKALDSLQYKTNYYWRVRGKNISGYSIYSAFRRFTTKVKPIIAPSGLVANNALAGQVSLNWNDNSDNEDGFLVLRKDGDSLSANQLMILDTLSANSTTYIDTTVSDSTQYSYLIYAFNLDTVSGFSNYSVITTLTDIFSAENSGLPMEFGIYQNYPNPFNPSTVIKYDIPKSSYVRLIVYNALGKEVAQLVSEEKPAGSYEVSFNAEGLAGGIYFYRLQAGNYSETKKFVLLK